MHPADFLQPHIPATIVPFPADFLQILRDSRHLHPRADLCCIMSLCCSVNVELYVRMDISISALNQHYYWLK